MSISIKYSITLFVLLWCSAGKVPAQYLTKNSYYELSVSSLGSQSGVALAWNHLHSTGKHKRFKLGYGIRFTGNFGNSANFITAPARLTSTTTGPLVIFSDNKPENFDTLHFSSYQVNTLNISIHLNYAVSSKIDAEFNIDAVGFSFGSANTASYNTTKREQSPDQNTKQKARPTTFNALLTSDNDLGSLNSELLLRYWFKPRWAVKAGGAFIFTEYTTDNKLFLDNDRFRNKAFMAMIGVTYSPLRQ